MQRGYVDCVNGVWRMQGLLAVSRSIGDIHMKELISAEPEMKKLVITPDCEFLILASDGLWEKVIISYPFAYETHCSHSQFLHSYQSNNSLHFFVCDLFRLAMKRQWRRQGICV